MKEKLPIVKKFFALYVFLPIILDLIIESLSRKSLIAGMAYMFHEPALFCFNVLIIMLTISIAKFFQREIFVLSLISMIWLLFGVANFVILHFRVTPFSAVDFTLISSAISVSGHYLTPLNIAMILLALVMLVVCVICLFRKAPRYSHNTSRKAYVVSVSVMLTLVCSIAYMHHSSTSVQALANNYTNISEAYENYGFVYCFANSIIDTGISKPEEYSQENMQELEESMEEKESKKLKKPNIVMIQLESFFDVDVVKDLKLSQDAIPNFHKLQNDYSDGLLTVPTVGAGTVNTEFEILTGMRQQDFGVSEYPYKTILKSTPSESICQDLAELGYTSHGVHNNTATFYGRNKVFSNLGFNTFTSIEYMDDVEMNPNGWAKDAVLVDEIIRTLDSTEEMDFTFGITVQSHGKYDGIEPEESWPIEVLQAPEGMEESYHYYVNQLYEVDQMLGKLVAKLEARKEPTILVLYGDHLPSLELQDADLTNGSQYQTQYVVWDNLGMAQQDKDLATYQLYPWVLNLADIHEGIITKYHQQKDWEREDYLEGLQKLEYDLLYGKNYIYDGENPYDATQVQMGVRKIQITDITASEEGYLVKGEGFTPYCKILFDGKEVRSQWIDSGSILVQEEIIPEEVKKKKEPVQEEELEADEVPNAFVVQVQTGDGVELSMSEAFLWDELELTQ